MANGAAPHLVESVWYLVLVVGEAPAAGMQVSMAVELPESVNGATVLVQSEFEYTTVWKSAAAQLLLYHLCLVLSYVLALSGAGVHVSYTVGRLADCCAGVWSVRAVAVQAPSVNDCLQLMNEAAQVSFVAVAPSSVKALQGAVVVWSLM